MLDLLRSAHGHSKIFLTPKFKKDLRWFAKFLPSYNGVSLYDHKPIGVTLELDACLTGFGGPLWAVCLPSSNCQGLQAVGYSSPGDGKHSHCY